MDKTPEQVAELFHDTYECLAPEFGYETRQDTKKFDPQSKNGKLMVATCAAVIAHVRPQIEAEARAAAFADAVGICEEKFCMHQGFAGPTFCVLSIGHQGPHIYGLPIDKTARTCAFELRARSGAPPGHVCVPVEPTKDMMNAGDEAIHDGLMKSSIGAPYGLHPDHACWNVYKAMLAARLK
jgi:hypothetical protein